jgi:hypothetical protein
VAGIPQIWYAVNFFMNVILIFTVVPKYLHFAPFSKDSLLVFTLCYNFGLCSGDKT